MEEPATKEAEALGMAVVGEDDARARDRALRRAHAPARAVALDGDGGGVLEEADRCCEAVGEGADVGGGLHDRRAGHVDAGGEGGGAGDGGDGGGVEPGVGLVELVELGGVGGEVPVAFRRQREVVAAAGVEDVAGEGALGGEIGREGDGAALDGDVVAALLQGRAAVVLGRDLVRQVDDEAGVAAGRALADDAGLEHGDREAPGRAARGGGRRRGRRSRRR